MALYLCLSCDAKHTLSCVWIFATPWTGPRQVPLAMETSRWEYWSGMPFPSPRGLPDSGTNPRLQVSGITGKLTEEAKFKIEYSVCKNVGKGLNPWVGKTSWRSVLQLTSVFLPGESHVQRSLAGYSPSVHKEWDRTELLSAAQHRRRMTLPSAGWLVKCWFPSRSLTTHQTPRAMWMRLCFDPKFYDYLNKRNAQAC